MKFAVRWLALLLVSFLFPPLLMAKSPMTWAGCGITKSAFMLELAKAFKQETGQDIYLSGGGATKGIREVANGNVTLGGTCRHLILDDAEKGVKLHPVAWDALVAITHPDVTVDNITHEQLRQVLTGKITNWRELGGEDQPIVLMLRNGKLSGVEMMARELLFGDLNVEFVSQKILDESGPLEFSVKETPYAFGISGVSSSRRNGLKILNLDGIPPSQENIIRGSYKLFRPMYLVTSNTPSPEVKQFLAFVKSAKGQEIISKTGTVNLDEGQHLWQPYRQHMKQVIKSGKGIFDKD
ncbi:MAG: phosphate ABC transporter substrate-binding protein [Magnetococcales bacterium]|nr:phosphate ABC transporter substrate-binding protein [Magnetococcales bacterium]NGZ29113.1 phosphate ABC transporter substrate-binding protein [Magnetococcales bacterium]